MDMKPSKNANKNFASRSQRCEVLQLYNDGFTLRTIAENVRLSPRQVKRIVDTARSRGYVERRKRRNGRPHTESQQAIEDARINNIIAEMYNVWHTQREIAHEIGYSESTIRRRIKKIRREGRIKREGNRLFDMQSIARIVEKYDCGWAMKRIADEVGASTSHIRRIIYEEREKGNVSRSKGTVGRSRERDKIDQSIADLYNRFVTLEEIAKRLGISLSSVRNRVSTMRSEKRLIKRPKHHNVRTQKANERYRRILHYQQDQGMSIAEIAKREGIGKGTVEYSLYRGKKKFANGRYESITVSAKKKRIRKAVLLENEGVHKITIAKILEVKVKTVEKYLREGKKKKGKAAAQLPPLPRSQNQEKIP